MSIAYIEFKKVNKVYKMGEVEIKALNNTSFEIEKGQLICILGPSGAGKTTCLNILGGMDRLTSGNVIVDGKIINDLNEKQLIKYRRNDIGFVFQFYNLIQNMTVIENVELATQLCKNSLDPSDILDKVGLKNRKNNFPAQLSGGEQQRVAIARAICKNPKLLLCDEPTGNLDPDTSKEIMDVINKINKELGTTVVMATHDKDIVNRMKKRVVVIKDGLIEGDYLKGSYKVNENI